MKKHPYCLKKQKAISLFSGAGGMDVGFIQAGFEVVWANDTDKDACETYKANLGDHIVCGNINDHVKDLDDYAGGIDCIFGGPPCQGFSVAGNMNPNDERNKLVMSFMDVIRKVKPRSFVMENVKPLATLEKFREIRETLILLAKGMGYKVELLVLNSCAFGVPQSGKRMFLIGFKEANIETSLTQLIARFEQKSPTVRDVIASLGKAGNPNNSRIVKAKISIAKSPVLRKSPYAGMLFNGQGRPLNPDAHSSTLHASMGGNRTPIIDEEQLYNNKPAWVEKYHAHLMNGGKPYETDAAPKRLRRLTVDEAHLIQTFPMDFDFIGRQLDFKANW